MRVAILGTRGVPARYGGFETFAEELGARLAARGHAVTVYTRRTTNEAAVDEYRGMTVRVLPALRLKALETLSHTTLSVLSARRAKFDAILLCNAANAPLIPLLHVKRLRVVLNVDGIERRRRKWGAVGRAYYRLCEALAARWADELVTDAEVIRRYYRRVHGRGSAMVPYGGDLPRPEGNDTLCHLGVAPGSYFLYVSRFEPENNPDRVVEAYREVPGDVPLVMVGGAPYARALIRKVRGLAERDRRVILPGPIYGLGYRELLFNARAYIHATEVGGTHPALVEAMGAGRTVLYLDNAANREVVGDAGLPFDFQCSRHLGAVLTGVVAGSVSAAGLGARAQARVAERYRWDDVASAYERLLESAC